MSASLRRRVIDLACRTLQAALPPALRPWAWAVRCEAAGIPDDTQALLFTLDSLCGLLPRAIAARLLHPFAAPVGDGTPLFTGSTIMTLLDTVLRRPRALGIACAIGAVALGLAYLAIVGAPARYLAVNAGSLAIGLTTVGLFGRTVSGRARTGGAIVAMASGLLATALLGAEVEGAARWVTLGGLSLQPSLILLPAMLVAFSRIRTVPVTAGIVVAAAAMALQPDRAMAGMLVTCLAALAVVRPDRHVIVALGASVAGFAATLARADMLPAVPYVDQILYSSFAVNVGAGLAVFGGLALLLIPAIVGWGRDAGNRAAYAAFGAVWLAAIVAAALGNYPTPIVGYGGSAIIGYVLSLLALPKPEDATARAANGLSDAADGSRADRHLRVALA